MTTATVTDRYVLNQSWNRIHRLARFHCALGGPLGFGFCTVVDAFVGFSECVTGFSDKASLPTSFAGDKIDAGELVVGRGFLSSSAMADDALPSSCDLYARDGNTHIVEVDMSDGEKGPRVCSESADGEGIDGEDMEFDDDGEDGVQGRAGRSAGSTSSSVPCSGSSTYR